jgi:hypothetical protein
MFSPFYVPLGGLRTVLIRGCPTMIYARDFRLLQAGWPIVQFRQDERGVTQLPRLLPYLNEQ